MTLDDVKTLVKEYVELLEDKYDTKAYRADISNLHSLGFQASLDHVTYMCYEMLALLEEMDGFSGEDKVNNNKDVEKLHRCLGFIQGVLWSERVYTIDDMRHHNSYGTTNYHIKQG